MSRRDRREFASRLAVLVMHLLKWCYQPTRRSHSWRLTISEQRHRLKRLLRHHPSPSNVLPQALIDTYPHAYPHALTETRLPATAMPRECPWMLDQILDEDFWPESDIS